MSQVTRIYAITLIITNMEKSCNFYSNIPGFKLIHGGSPNDFFPTYQVGKFKNITHLNLELKKLSKDNPYQPNNGNHFGRIIFYTDNVDRLYS